MDFTNSLSSSLFPGCTGISKMQNFECLRKFLIIFLVSWPSLCSIYRSSSRLKDVMAIFLSLNSSRCLWCFKISMTKQVSRRIRFFASSKLIFFMSFNSSFMILKKGDRFINIIKIK